MCEKKPGERCSGHARQALDQRVAELRAAYGDSTALEPLTSAAEQTRALTTSPNKWTADTVDEALASLPVCTPKSVPTVDAKKSAAALRSDLKTVFGHRFSVRMSTGTGYGWVSVNWQDGPRSEDVQGLAHQYQAEEFNGMDDSYHRVNEGAPVRYSLSGVNTHRSMGERGRNYVSDVLTKAGITDFEAPRHEGWDDLAHTFRHDRYLSENEQHRILSVLGSHSYNPLSFQSAQSVAQYIHGHTSFSSEVPEFDHMRW